MMKTNFFKRVMWLARGTSMVLGLALMLALVMGVATMAFAATGGNFILGQTNKADQVSKLVNTAASGAALELRVKPGNAPLTVNSSEHVENLNADKLDDKEAPLVASVASDGNVSAEQNPDVVSSQKLRTGVYIVQFARDVHSCHRVAGLGAGVGEGYSNPNVVNGDKGEVSTFNSGDPATGGIDESSSRIAVATYDSTGTLADRPFNLAVFC